MKKAQIALWVLAMVFLFATIFVLVLASDKATALIPGIATILSAVFAVKYESLTTS